MNREPSATQFADIPDPCGPSGDTGGPLEPRSRPSAFSPTRVHTRRVRSIALVAALAYDGVLVALRGAHPEGRSVPTLAVGLAVPVVACAIALAAAAGRGRRGLGLPAARISAASIVALVLFVSASLLLLPYGPPGSASLSQAVPCVVTGALLALGPVACVTMAWRRAFAVASVWRTCALGVACGGLAAAALALICPDVSGAHVATAHAAALLLGGAAGAFLARWTAIG
jgi:hypothetical protein